ncbi:MAG: TaqI-like C-terminal specificity domain-containing protein [Candidatus Methanoperedens sp.]|nr:TaqI-like C-terminal specificity domain-containing protein [Candidatus Methanoperedens sp.]
MTQLAIAARDNKNLFSNYYLDNQIKNNSEWKKEEHKAAFSEIKKLYDTEKDFLPTLNEKQLEQRFFAPIFKILNHTVEVNEGTEQREFPDYAFFPDRASLDDAHKKIGNSFYDNAFAIGEVKRWGIELDRFGKDEKDRKRNPSLQIWIYLHDVTPKWGILSNGAKWRLYCKERRRDDYYEIDLPSLLATNDIENFKYFYYFFRRDAYLRSTDGKIFLDEVLKGSADYAKDIGDDLKDNVYKAMKKVAEGFFSWSQNGLDVQNEAARETVQKCTMLLLYRFLFLLYAEGKGLLDLKKPQYQSYSFYKLKNEVKEKQDGPLEQRYLGVGTTLWSRLKDTFRLINQGSESFGIDKNVLNVPAYNGGLFDPQKNPELEKWVIGDTFLSEAINLLSRSKAKGGKLDFVDYSTLEIRHLGSIYEGLLEYKLRVAEDEMVVNGGEWVKLEEFNKDRKQKKVFSDFDEFDRVRKGQIYLATDKGDRKATGSYYTPDYIVNYIVKNTVGPVVDEKWKEAEANKKSFVDATLSVKVLDPAMGSGHFLVGSIEFLSEKLLLAVKKDIDNGRFSDESHLTSDWARREVVAHCIYGVDLNLMAVELAKVGLWLTTISKEKPLSFLDHRLKQGNSLIGARLSDLKTYPGAKKKDKEQTTLPSFISPLFITHLIGKIAELDKIKDERLEDIKRKERVFAEFKQLPEYRKAKALADVFTGVYFGNEVKPTENKDSANVYYDLFWAIMGDESEWRRKTNRDWFAGAEKIAQEKSFFHWELEFPEIFFEGGAPKENPGWDAVVGNPPYVRQERLDPLEKTYVEDKYTVAYAATDLYAYFIEKGVKLLSAGSKLGFICSNKFARTKYGEGLRNFLLKSCKIQEMYDFQDVTVFEGITTYPLILILTAIREGENVADNLVNLGSVKPNFVDLHSHLSNIKKKLPQKSLGSGYWDLSGIDSGALKDKIENQSIKLKEYIKCSPLVGIKTGFNEAFHVDSATANNLLIAEPSIPVKPLIYGKNIKRYSVEHEGTYLINSTDNTVPDIEKFPNLVKYLNQFKEQIFQSYHVRHGAKWWQIREPKSDALMKASKIVYPNVANGCSFALDNEGMYVDMTGFVIPSSDIYLLTILNSKVIEYIFKSVGVQRRGGYYEFKIQYVDQLPIRRISFTTPPARRAALYEEAKALYTEFLGASSGTAPDSRDPAFKCGDFVGVRLDAKPEESDVVHDLLAHLAERMIEMNKEKNAEIKGFLDFLKGEIGASIDDLSNKTAIQEYYNHEFQTLIDVLVKNKKKLKAGYDPKNPNNYKILKDWYDDSTKELAPLMRRIEATDGLIDAIVYRLYGLTEDEVKIVEGSISGEKNAKCSSNT